MLVLSGVTDYLFVIASKCVCGRGGRGGGGRGEGVVVGD